MKWRTFLTDLYKARSPEAAEGLRFYPPVSQEQLTDFGTLRGSGIPHSLDDLLLDSNGIMQWITLANGQQIDTGWLIWPLEEIRKVHKARYSDPKMLDYYGPLDGRLLFANAGVDGITIACQTSENQSTISAIYIWHPMDRRSSLVADSLEAFFEKWLGGKILI